jgi:ankyrin repeat protein
MDSGWDVNSATANGTTALMMAAPDKDKTALLIAHGARVNAKSKTRYTALMIAASHHATGSVRLLLDQGAEVQAASGDSALFDVTPLFFAAWSGDVESIAALHKRGAKSNPAMLVGGRDTQTALNNVANLGDSAAADALIRYGAPVDDTDPDTGITPLDWAVFKNDVKLARLLISRHADVNHRDKLGYTPLHWAANIDFGSTTMLELLLKAGADPRQRNEQGMTPLELATKYKHSRQQVVLSRSLTRH